MLKANESSPGKRRHFCSNCGTHLVAERLGQALVVLRVATLDDDLAVRPQAHIWYSHDASWLWDTDGVAVHKEWQPGR